MEERFPGLKVAKGNVRTLFVMKIRYLNNRSIAINIKEYIIEAVQEFGKYVSQAVTSPSERWIFKVGRVRELQGKRIDNLHFSPMKLLWISQIVLPDCDTTIPSLCTRMKQTAT